MEIFKHSLADSHPFCTLRLSAREGEESVTTAPDAVLDGL
jgi:hypothetical protein